MRRMKLLGLVGQKLAGKDTVYGMLKKQLPGLTVERIAFADALKQEIATAIGRDIRYIEDHKDNFRLIMQGWGSDFRRKLNGETYWTDKVLVKLLASTADLCVITDVRFKNEADLVKEVGGKLWRIVRDPKTDGHASEVELLTIPCDYTIYNLHSLAELDHDIQLAYQQTLK